MIDVSNSSNEATLEALRGKLAIAESEMGALQKRIDALRTACTEVEALMGQAADPKILCSREGRIPTASEAVRLVMEAIPKVWNIAELGGELASRGWSPSGVNPEASLRATVHRLTKAGDLRVVDRGRYQIATAGVDESPHAVDSPTIGPEGAATSNQQ
ncbi:hypothetical protein [Ferrimicrobium acidiphilum]|jgi:hypothetical protein|uniref:hypothetical protein n=1 Tax=Ferrimicrobium acidiphilum TaxID=121039 RepID=UPI0023F029DA|nr:hypothetical protein [Ferrimicrobium acidiphilum]